MPQSLKLDHGTRSFLQFRLRARPDLVVTPILSAKETWYRVECPATERFFRLGATEYAFLSFLDGKSTVADVISQMAQSGDEFAIEERQGEVIVSWLIENRLIEGDDTEAVGLEQSIQTHQQRRLAEVLNPFWMKFPLVRPDRWIVWCLPSVNWLFSPAAFVLAVLLGLYAGLVAIANWHRFQDPIESVFHPSNWFWLGMTWVALKCVHELSHAFVCRRYGGEVREMGIILILFAPVAYVDVTSSHRFTSRWQRIHVAAAGMYAELIIASIAILIWSQTTTPVAAQRLLNVIWMAGFSTLVFNANPLMKFDGYHILADWLDIPNLAARGRESVWNTACQFLFGFERPTTSSLNRNERIMFIYGLSASIWNTLFGICMLIAASAYWQGAGLFLVGLALCIWLGRPIVSTIAMLQEIAVSRPQSLRRAGVIVPAVVLTIVLSLVIIPWPFARTAPGYLEYRDFVTVRAKASGFVQSIHVRDGERVEAGQLLIELQNEELEVELGQLQITIQQSDLRMQQLLKSDRQAEFQIEQEKKNTHTKRLVELERRIEQTRIHAPIAGCVMARDLKSRLETFVQEGTELVMVGHETEKEFRASLSQEDAKLINDQATLRIRLPQFGALEGTARVVTPLASRVPPHQALAVNGGGSLPVRMKSPDQKKPNEKEHFEFVEPRVTVAFTIADSSAIKSWPTGTTGFVRIHSHQYRSLGHGLWRTAHDLIKNKIDSAWQVASAK